MDPCPCSAKQIAEDTSGQRMAESLSPRERELVSYVADAMDYSEIGALMKLSPDTIKKHMYSACIKMGINNRHELIVSVYRHPALLAACTPPSMKAIEV